MLLILFLIFSWFSLSLLRLTCIRVWRFFLTASQVERTERSSKSTHTYTQIHGQIYIYICSQVYRSWTGRSSLARPHSLKIQRFFRESSEMIFSGINPYGRHSNRSAFGLFTLTSVFLYTYEYLYIHMYRSSNIRYVWKLEVARYDERP